jgi:type I restriction enzyme M protein
VKDAVPPPAHARLSRLNVSGVGIDLGFLAELFEAGDKYIALRLILPPRQVSDALKTKRVKPLADDPEGAEDRDEYAPDDVFWVPPAGNSSLDPSLVHQRQAA